MNISERNKKVALARWKKKHLEERRRIENTIENILLKACLCGFLAGDGSVQKRKEKNFYHYQIDFFPDDLIMLNTFLNAVEKVCGKKPTVREHNHFFSARLSSKVVVEDILKVASFGLKTWSLPKKLFSVPGAKEEWIKAFFSAEAYVNKKSIKIQAVNEKGMVKIAHLLQEMGIHSRCYSYNQREKTCSRVHILFINRREDKETFYKKVGFFHEKKTKLLEESLGL